MEENKIKTLKALIDVPNVVLTPNHYYNQLYLKDYEMVVHGHSYIEIMYSVKNSFIFEYHTTQSHRCITIPKGSFVLINPGTYHKISITDDVCRIMNVEFLPQILCDNSLRTFDSSTSYSQILKACSTLKDIFNNDDPFYVFTDYDLYVKSAIEQIIQEISAKKPAADSAYLIRLLVAKLFVDISRCSQNIGLERNCVVYLRKALYYIQKNPNNVTVENLANECGISKAYLQRLFKKELNESIVSITTKVRLHNAKKLLANSSMTIEKIASTCGYKNRRHLLTLFRRYEGCTPTEYRNNNEEKEIPTSLIGIREQFLLNDPTN